MGCDPCFQPGYEQENSLDPSKEFEKVNSSSSSEEEEENIEASETQIIFEQNFGKEFEKENYLNYPPKKPNKPKKKNSPEESKVFCGVEVMEEEYPGFLLKFPDQEKQDNYLIIDVKNMKKELIDTLIYRGLRVSFSYGNNRTNDIFLWKYNRKMKAFIKELGLNLFVIGLFDDDTIIDKNKFLDAYLPEDKDEIEINQEITIGENENFQSKIENLTENGFSFKVNDQYKDQIKPGYPILSKENKKVIGIVKETKSKDNEYEAVFIWYVKLKEEKIEKFNGYFGDYFGKATQNGIPDKKGFYKFNNLEFYKGDISLDNFEGNGYYEYEYFYYIGQFKNNLREGNGILYYSDGKLLYRGQFQNDKFHGHGKFYWREGEYYEGEFQNGLNHGKGTLYYKNGKIKYEGDFVNDKFEGKGKYYYLNGHYYIGDFKNGLKHGKGTLFANKEKKIYDGEFRNGNFEGQGKYIYENGDYYIGEFKNGVCHGKGVECDKNGNKLSEGVWENDEKK